MLPQNDRENSDHSIQNLEQVSDNEERKDHVKALEPGAAGRRMQQLAMEIYDSTPKIVERKQTQF